MIYKLSLLVYNVLLPLGLVAMLPGALRKMKRRGGAWRDLKQRIGIWDRVARASLARSSRYERRFWLHAVSVGEVGVAVRIIDLLLKRAPTASVVLTVTTPTGHQVALRSAAKHGERMVVLYSPIDFPPVVSRILDVVSPQHVVLVEAEVWPNLVAEAERRRILVTLANARLSGRSESRFRRLLPLVEPIFSRLTQVLVTEPEDVERWVELGVDSQRIRLTGNVKYDPGSGTVSPEKVAVLRNMLGGLGVVPGQHRVLLAASTHPGEETALARVFLQLKEESRLKNLVFLIAPRHVERTREIEAELVFMGLRTVKRSEKVNQVHAEGSDVDKPWVLLIDTTGELGALQSCCDLVIIGKSFLARGGQNPAEAVLAGCPVIFGPHMENFAPLVKLLLAEKGAVQVDGLASLVSSAQSLLLDSTLAARMAEAGRSALAAHSGATEKTVQWLLSRTAEATLT